MSPAIVTVIIAAHNEERHIAECLESLLNQTYPAIEIIVVDDGSTDVTVEIVRRFRSVTVILQKHEGKAKAVNLAAQSARGEVLLFLDGDMVFDREYIERMVAPILANECVGTCHTEEYVANPANTWSAGLQAFCRRPPNARLVVTPAQRVAGSQIYRAVRTVAFLKVGGFSDAGYEDDRTLSPKLQCNARWVDAVCHHYNVETIAEVFNLGVWVGKSWFQRRGPRPLAKFSPVASVGRTIAGVVATRSLLLAPFQLVYEAGIFLGILKMTMRIDRAYGR